MTKNNGADVQPTSQLATQVSWTIAEAAVGDVFRFYYDSTLKYTITIIASSGGGGGEEGDAI